MSGQGVATRGVVGRRQITCLQTIDIGRLTSDPVFLAPGGFIAVTGQGPIDSNESSKTTFEAALSLVHGDPGWRQESPQFSGYAAELLFNPPNAPTGARVRADVGFVVAVFAGETDDSGKAADGHPVTVWIRIRRHDDPSFEVAVARGVQLATGDTHGERITNAKRAWSTLRGPKWGPQRYARELFGPGVSCLSYVSTRGGRSEQRTTLLGSDVSQLTPEQIAGQLVDLAGMRQLLDNEAGQRVDFFRLSRQLKIKENEVSKAAVAVTNFSGEVDAIDSRLAMLDAAEHARDRYVAGMVRQGLRELDELENDRIAANDAVDQAAQVVEKIRERLDKLDDTAVARQATRTAKALQAAQAERQPVADEARRLDIELTITDRDLAVAMQAASAWSGRRVTDIETDLAHVRELHEQAAVENRLAVQRVHDAEEHLAAVRQRTAGPAGTRLTAKDISWKLLHDAVELADDARPLFEPLLEPFAGAICVHPDDELDAIAEVADLPGTVLVSGTSPLPAAVLDAPPGAGGLLHWIATEARVVNGAATVPGRVTVVGGFAQPMVGHDAREAAASAALETAVVTKHHADERVRKARQHLQELLAELESASAEVHRQELATKRDQLRHERMTVTEMLTPLEHTVHVADRAHSEALAEQRGLHARQAEVADHLAACKIQLQQAKQKQEEVSSAADRILLASWVSHLDTCQPETKSPLINRVNGLKPLDLLDDVRAAIDTRARDVLAASPDATTHRDIMTRLETGLGVTVTVSVGRSEQTSAKVDGASLDTSTHAALVRYHEQAASVDRRRARDSEEREVVALDSAITALRTAVERHAHGMRSALKRAQDEHRRLRAEYDAAYDEVHAIDANLRNLQRSLEHQIRGLFDRVSKRFNEIRYRDGGHGGELDFDVVPPSLDQPDDNQPTGRGWTLRATPRWARRPPDEHGRPDHVSYHEQANTAQYKLATVQLVLAALLANDDPIGRLLILDELGDGLGEAHRERVLDALRRAAEETGITVLATVQDDIQHEAFARCSEVLLLRYPSTNDLLNEPTYMFAGSTQDTQAMTLVPLRDALTTARGPGWSTLLTVYDHAAATEAAHRRAYDDVE